MNHLSKAIAAGINLAGAITCNQLGCGKTAAVLLFVSIAATIATIASGDK